MDRDYEQIYAEAEFRHPWNLARRELFSSLAGSDRSARILDVGCGTGHFLAHLERLGFENLAGFEPSTNLRATLPDLSVEISSSLPEDRFHKIFLLDVLEHIEDDLGMLVDVRRLLEPGGRIFVSVPAHPLYEGRAERQTRARRLHAPQALVLEHVLLPADLVGSTARPRR